MISFYKVLLSLVRDAESCTSNKIKSHSIQKEKQLSQARRNVISKCQLYILLRTRSPERWWSCMNCRICCFYFDRTAFLNTACSTKAPHVDGTHLQKCKYFSTKPVLLKMLQFWGGRKQSVCGAALSFWLVTDFSTSSIIRDSVITSGNFMTESGTWEVLRT